MIAVLDANVLYPAPVRDLLLSLAAENLFQPKWSDRIQEEWSRNLLINRPDIKAENIRKTITAMNLAFPDADTKDDHFLIKSLFLPDKDDRHVLATAIKTNAGMIITNNLKDFPKSILKEHGLRATLPDDFVMVLLKREQEKVYNAFYKMVERLQNPVKTKMEVIEILGYCNLIKTAENFRKANEEMMLDKF